MLDNFYKLLMEKYSKNTNHIYLFKKKIIFELINIYILDECDDLSIDSEDNKNFFKKKCTVSYIKQQYYTDLYVFTLIFYFCKKNYFCKELFLKILSIGFKDFKNMNQVTKEYDNLNSCDGEYDNFQSDTFESKDVPEKVSYKINLMFNKLNFNIHKYWIRYNHVYDKKFKVIKKKKKNDKTTEFLQYINSQSYFIKLFLYEYLSHEYVSCASLSKLCIFYFDLLEYKNIYARLNFFNTSYYLNSYYYERKFISYFFSKKFTFLIYKKIQKKLSENIKSNDIKLFEPNSILCYIYATLFENKYILLKDYLPYLTTKYSESLMTKTLTKNTMKKRSFSYLANYNIKNFKKNNKTYYIALKILENYLNDNTLNPNNIDAKICKKIFEKKNNIYKQTLYDKSNMIYEIINNFISKIIFIEPFLESKNKMYYKFLLLEKFPAKINLVDYENEYKNNFMYHKLKHIIEIKNECNQEHVLEYYYYLINLLKYDYKICKTFIDEICRFTKIPLLEFNFTIHVFFWHTSSFILFIYFDDIYIYKLFLKNKNNQFEIAEINNSNIENNKKLIELLNVCLVLFNGNNIYNLDAEISLMCLLFENFIKFKQFYNQMNLNDVITIQNHESQVYLRKKPFDDYQNFINNILLQNENEKPFIIQNFAKKWFI
jgi:hypothetical protein